MKTALIFSILTVACSATFPPEHNCLPVNYEGSAEWVITPNELILEPMKGDFTGSLIVSITEVDSGQQLTGIMVGEFTAPIGDSSFVCVGSMKLFGTLTFIDEEYSIIFRVISGTEDFAGVTGYIESSWKKDDERVYYGGTLCFVNKIIEDFNETSH